jgi:sortase A
VLWSASVVAVGLVILGWSFFGVRETMPPQVSPVPTSEVPNWTATPDATISEPPVAPVLYEARPNLGDRVGTISLPRLKLNWPIYEGTTDAQLAKGVGHYVKSVLPGETDNTVLSGHRTTVFNRLGELKVADHISIKTKAGIFIYKIREFRIVSRTDKTVIVPTDTAVLTLTTCYPFNNVGVTTKAFIVVADLVTEN